MRLQAILRIVLVLALVILLGTLSQLYKTELDWTYGDRNSLSEASLELLERMPGPIVFTAFTSADAEMKRTILADLARYQRVRDNIEVEFVDPSRNPQRAREAELAVTRLIGLDHGMAFVVGGIGGIAREHRFADQHHAAIGPHFGNSALGRLDESEHARLAGFGILLCARFGIDECGDGLGKPDGDDLLARLGQFAADPGCPE